MCLSFDTSPSHLYFFIKYSRGKDKMPYICYLMKIKKTISTYGAVFNN